MQGDTVGGYCHHFISQGRIVKCQRALFAILQQRGRVGILARKLPAVKQAPIA